MSALLLRNHEEEDDDDDDDDDDDSHDDPSAAAAAAAAASAAPQRHQSQVILKKTEEEQEEEQEALQAAAAAVSPLRHDEQEDEAHYDDRIRTSEEDEDENDEENDDDDDDDLSKNKGRARTTLLLRFPKDKLFGREKELQKLDEIISRLVLATTTSSSSSSANTTNTITTTTTTTTTSNNQKKKKTKLEIVLLEGYSGSGKSELVHHYFAHVRRRQLAEASSSSSSSSSSHPMFLFCSGKYNEPRDSASSAAASSSALSSSAAASSSSGAAAVVVPYSGIAQALTMLASQYYYDGGGDAAGAGRSNTTTTSTTTSMSMSTSTSSTTAPSSCILESEEDEKEDDEEDREEDHEEEDEEEETGDEFWEQQDHHHSLLLPEDIRLLVQIAPGLAPFLPIHDKRKRRRRRRQRQQQELGQQQDQEQEQGRTNKTLLVDDDSSINTLVTSNRKKITTTNLLASSRSSFWGKKTKTMPRSLCSLSSSYSSSSSSSTTTSAASTPGSSSATATSTTTATTTTATVDIRQIAMVVSTFLQMIIRKQQQQQQQKANKNNENNTNKEDDTTDSSNVLLVFFLDDLQWMDSSSLELLQCLWKDDTISTMPPWMFIGAIRSASTTTTTTTTTTNSTGTSRSACSIMSIDTILSCLPSSTTTTTASPAAAAAAAGGVTFTKIPVRNLSPSQVLRFVAETLDKVVDDDEKDVDPAATLSPATSPLSPSPSSLLLEEVEPLAQFIYSRTLGNIFYVRQIMESLVRRNIIYYDVMWFEWQFNPAGLNLSTTTTRNADDGLLVAGVLQESDILQMVQDQMAYLDDGNLQRALIVASYIRHSIDTLILFQCLQAVVIVEDAAGLTTSTTSSSPSMMVRTPKELEQLLEQGVEQGLLLKDSSRSSSSGCSTTTSPIQNFKFAHDRVQEAAYAMIPMGTKRDALRGQIGRELLRLVVARNDQQHRHHQKDSWDTDDSNKSKEREWLYFVAVDHLNSLPIDHPLRSEDAARMEFLRANCHVGCLCLSKASFEQAVVHFRIVAKAIHQEDDEDTDSSPSTSFWKKEYAFCLNLYNRLLETEFILGNHAETERAIGLVLEKAKCTRDMADAHYTRIQMIVKTNDDDRSLGAKEAAKLLSEYGQITIPEHPTAADILKERLRFKVALGARPISCLASLPVMEDDWQMKLLSQLIFISNMSSNAPLHLFACLRALRLSVEQGVSKYLLVILSDHCGDLRREGKLQAAYSFAKVMRKLYERFPNEKGSEYATSRLILHSGMLHLKEPFLESMDAFLVNYRLAMAAGNVEIALTSAMHFPLVYFASGLPLNALLEPKLILFQGKAQQLGRPSFVAIFQLCLQFVWRLQGKTATTTTTAIELSSGAIMSSRAVMTEDQILQDLHGRSREMALRDSAIFRLFLAYVSRDEVEMVTMMDRLDDYPLFDLPLVRQHLRLTFHGLSALTLGRTRRDKVMLSKGQAMMKELRKLESIGSLNARPAYLCLRAVEKNKKQAYDDAISACSKAQLGHLEAIMNEQCAMMLATSSSRVSNHKGLSEQDRLLRLSHEYMENALWLYHDWGALAKATELRNRFEFLNPSGRDDGASDDGNSTINSFFFGAEPNIRFGGKDVLASTSGGGGGGASSNGPPTIPVRSQGPPTMPRRSSSPPSRLARQE